MQTTKTCSKDIIRVLKIIFARFGIPDVLVSNNGPQFSSAEFVKFAEDYEFIHVTSSPHNPQSNGEAQRAVQIAKAVLAQEDPELALMAYRATPVTSTGFSPAQLLMGYQIKTSLPTLAHKLEPEWPDSELVRQNDRASKECHKYYYDRHYGVCGLPELATGQQVLTKTDQAKTWGSPSTVTVQAATPRSIIIDNKETDHQLCRNQRHLLMVDPPTDSSTPHTDVLPPMVPTPTGRPLDAVPSVTTRSGRLSRPMQRLDL